VHWGHHRLAPSRRETLLIVSAGGASHALQRLDVFLGDFAPNTTSNVFPNVAVDAALKNLAIEVDPSQRPLAFVARLV
jgi:hypothetical protein